MNNKKMVRIVAVLLAAIMALSFLFSVLASVADAAPTKEQLNKLKNEQKGIKQEMQDLRSKINSLEFEQTVITAKKEVLDEQIALTEQEIENISQQIIAYDELIAEKELEAQELQRQEDEQWELYKVRIRAMEENGTISYYAIVFGARSFADMLSRLDAVDSIMERDEEIYEELIAAKEATKQAKLDIEATKQEQIEVRQELEDTTLLLQEQVDESARLIAELKQNIDEYSALYEEKNKEENEILAKIAEMEEEIRKAAANSVKGTGTFIWPTKESYYVTSLFGTRWHPVLQMYKSHNGVDIGRVGYGTDVIAADTGTVMTAQYSSSYGNYVTISHGNGYTTLYAHMSKLNVKSGQKVSQGDVIGYAGSTGISTGTHIHFEVWYNGSRVDPLGFFTGYEVSPNA